MLSFAKQRAYAKASMPDLLITGGRVIDPASGIDAPRSVLVRGKKIAAILRPGTKLPHSRTIDARGCWVVPGLIDLHVHLRDLRQTEDETIGTGTRAAALGGVTTVLAMANTRPVTDTPALIRQMRKRARAHARVNVLFAGAVTLKQEGQHLTELARIASAGAAAFSDDGRPIMNAELMRQALKESKRLQKPVLDHAEDDHLTGKGIVHEGEYSRKRRLPGIPSISESLMAQRDITLAELTGGHLHICHVSCAETVDLIRQAKKRGAPITAEAAPHHFTLVDTDIPGTDPNYKMKPPLRARRDRAAVLAGLADGTIDAIATDHAPHAPAKKARGICGAPFGVIGLETLLPLSLRLVERGILTRKKLIERLSTSPARILRLEHKGHLRARSADADITLINPSARWAIDAVCGSKSRNTPFTGRRLKGCAQMTIVGGKIIYDRDKPL